MANQPRIFRDDLLGLGFLLVPFVVAVGLFGWQSPEMYPNPDPGRFIHAAWKLHSDWGTFPNGSPPLRHALLGGFYTLVQPTRSQAPYFANLFAVTFAYLFAPLSIWAFTRVAVGRWTAYVTTITYGLFHIIGYGGVGFFYKGSWQYFIALPFFFTALTAAQISLENRDGYKYPVVSGVFLGVLGAYELPLALFATLIIASSYIYENAHHQLLLTGLSGAAFLPMAFAHEMFSLKGPPTQGHASHFLRTYAFKRGISLDPRLGTILTAPGTILTFGIMGSWLLVWWSDVRKVTSRILLVGLVLYLTIWLPGRLTTVLYFEFVVQLFGPLFAVAYITVPLFTLFQDLVGRFFDEDVISDFR